MSYKNGFVITSIVIIIIIISFPKVYSSHNVSLSVWCITHFMFILFSIYKVVIISLFLLFSDTL